MSDLHTTDDIDEPIVSIVGNALIARRNGDTIEIGVQQTVPDYGNTGRGDHLIAVTDRQALVYAAQIARAVHPRYIVAESAE